jgi:predicted DNA-binding transcriptional regulator AlpA
MTEPFWRMGNVSATAGLGEKSVLWAVLASQHLPEKRSLEIKMINWSDGM